MLSASGTISSKFLKRVGARGFTQVMFPQGILQRIFYRTLLAGEELLAVISLA